jgi:hypothetical protein
MKKLWVWILAAVLFVGLGFALARIIGGKPSIEHQYQFSVQVNAIGDFLCTVTPTVLTLNKGDSGMVTITTSASGGFDGQIYFKVAGLPDGSYSFSASPINPGQSVTLTINSAMLTTNTMYVCQLVAADGPFEE